MSVLDSLNSMNKLIFVILFFLPVDFSASQVKKFFTVERAQFCELPLFNQANFNQAPDFDDASLPLPSFWKGHQRSAIAAFRALRRIASQGHDHENEAKAFKGEIRSKRFTEHKPWHLVFWFGILYDAIANFGQSATRPLLVWITQIVIFGYFYFREGYYRGADWLTCLQAGGDPLLQALLISVKNAFVAFASSRDPRIISAYECLYGPSTVAPHIPLRVTITEMLVQVPLSAALIFLFLLAVRNQFKIK